MRDRVFCIIVLYNAMQWIKKCLDSLLVSELPVSIVCIDNCSVDDTCKLIENDYPSVTLIKNEKNKGFGQANNQGIEYAYKNGATHFFLLNQDAWVFPTTIKELLKTQKEYSLGLVSPIHLNGDASLVDHNFFDALIINPKNNIMFRDVLLRDPKPYYTPKYTPCAAAWLLSKQCIETVGGFDPLFFHYGEDANLFQRALYHNVGVGVITNAFICHDREYHGNVVVYNKRRTLTQLLIKYADVNSNQTKKQEIKKIHLFFLKSFILLISRFEFSKASQIIGGYIQFFKKQHIIKKSIQTNRLVGPSWLKLSDC